MIDLEWKLTYVGSATSYVSSLGSFGNRITDFTSNEHDQELDSVLVGPIPVGVNKFEFRADPPDLSRIPNNEIIGVTVILLSCSYEDREFVRVGYYVNNEYTEEALQLEPPAKPIIEKVRRNILAEKPRVTRFAIKWYVLQMVPYMMGGPMARFINIVLPQNIQKKRRKLSFRARLAWTSVSSASRLYILGQHKN